MEHEWIPRIVLLIVMVGSGAALCWMAQAAASGRLKRNQLAGIRIPSTMASDEAWLAAHVRAKQPNLWSGIVAIAAGVFAVLPVPMPVVTVVILVVAILIMALLLYGARVGAKAANSVVDADPA